MPSAAAVYRHVRPRVAIFLISYQQRLRGYGYFTERYELHETSSKSELRPQHNPIRVKTFNSTRSQSRRDWGASKVYMGGEASL